MLSVYPALLAAGRSKYTSTSQYMRQAPLQSDGDVAAEWIALAPQALAAQLTCVPSLQQRLDTYTQAAPITGAELEREWRSGKSHQEVWQLLVADVTQKFMAMQTGSYLRQLETYNVAPGRWPMDQIVMDMRNRATVCLALVPDPVGADAANPPELVTSNRIIRAFGQMVFWQLSYLLSSCGFLAPSIQKQTNKWTITKLLSKLDELGQTEHEFAAPPATATGLAPAFDPAKTTKVRAAVAGADAESAGGGKGKKQKEVGVYTVEFARQNLTDIGLVGIAAQAVHAEVYSLADQRQDGCYNCGDAQHMFYDCGRQYMAASWAAVEKQRPQARKWRPTNNDEFQALRERIKKLRAALPAGKKGKPGGGRGR
jgi:hypothetical protein